jgi:hypothetical protein
MILECMLSNTRLHDTMDYVQCVCFLFMWWYTSSIILCSLLVPRYSVGYPLHFICSAVVSSFNVSTSRCTCTCILYIGQPQSFSEDYGIYSNCVRLTDTGLKYLCSAIPNNTSSMYTTHYSTENLSLCTQSTCSLLYPFV